MESVSQYPSFSALPERIAALYMKRYAKDFDNGYDSEAHYARHAALTAEFGKVVCVCIAKIESDEILVKTFCSQHEKKLLIAVKEFLDRNAKVIPLCAHNGFDFDFAFLFRRYLANGLTPPRVLNINALKKWEWLLHDTMNMWSHSEWNHKCSLDLLCEILDIPTPKGGITGADVGKIFWGMFKDGNVQLDRETEAIYKISYYCQGDTIALAKVWCKLKGFDVPTIAALVE